MIGTRKEDAFFKGAIFLAMRNLSIGKAPSLRETRVKPALPQWLLPFYFSHGLVDSGEGFEKINDCEDRPENI
jgi:hypothetical protein